MEPLRVVSFDVEEHYRIEAAAKLSCPANVREEYARRMERTTRMLLELLARANVQATFYIVGEIARTHPSLVKDIHNAGHEVGSHSWDHRRVHHFTPQTFREDLLRSKEALEDVTGAAVVGFRAPTFSVMRATAWATDVLADCGFQYDSSIFPVRHDRYGIPDAPRSPFIAVGRVREILELPPLTYRLLKWNLPVAGGGYFRLFPPAIMRAGLRQANEQPVPSVAMLYFHPWEFDPEQPRLPLGRIARWRTYVGMHRTTNRLKELLSRFTFTRAIDAAKAVQATNLELPRFTMFKGEASAV